MKVLFTILLVFSSLNVFAANYYVNDNSLTGDIYCSAIGNDANNGTDPSTPKATLKDILNDYDLEPGDIVYVDAGTYSDLDVDNSNDNGFTVQGAGNSLTIYDGANADRFWYSFDDHGDITFEDIKFYRYAATSDGGCFNQSNDGTSLTLNNCIIDDCDITGITSGGGAIRYYSANTLTLTDCTISNCSAPAGGSNDGGAIEINKSGASLIMNNCTFTSNSAGNGGAVSIWGIGAGTVTITSCTFNNNSSDDGSSYAQGGAILTGGAITGDITIEKCTFYGNNANEEGGACYFDTDGTIYLENCLFYENVVDVGASYGRGGALMFYCTGTHYITNCTFADNTATDEGGAIFLYSLGALIIEAKNSIFYNNISTAFVADDIDAGYETINLTNSSYTSAADIDLNGGSNTSPQTGDPSFTNSATDDYTISGSSICIDNGTSTGAPADDIIGTSRGGSPDIGAYELASNQWDGSSSSDWKTAANWSDNSVPTTESVIIPTSASYTNPPIIDEADAVCGGISLQGDAVLTLSSGKLTATGSVAMASTSEIQFDGGELECSGKFSADGILDINSGTLDVDGEFEVGSTLTEQISGGTIEVAGDFDGASEGDGDFTPTGGTVILNGFSGTTLDNHSSATFYNLTLDQAGVKSSSGSITVSNDFTINVGSQLTQSANRLTIAGNVDISGTLNHSGGNDIYLTGSSKALSGTGTQTTANYMLESGSNYNLTDDWSINSLETWTGGATFSVATTKTLTLASTFYTRTNANITLTGSANMTVGGDAWMAAEAGSIFNLNSGILDLNGANAYMCGGSGTFNANSGTINISSANSTISGTFNEGTSTVNFDGSAQNVPAETYSNLTISNAGTKTASGNIDVNGNLVTGATATCKLDLSSNDLTLAGNLTVGASDGLNASNAACSVTLDGSSNQDISHAGITPGTPTATLYLTSSGGSYTSEKWISVTTGVNNTGTTLWAQGNGTIGNSSGLLTDQSLTVTKGTTYYINAFDQYDDSWDGTTWYLHTATSLGGTQVATLSDPDDGADTDASGSWDASAAELETSTSFTYLTAASSAMFNDFVIANSGTGITLNSEISVDGTLTFTSGDIDASSNNLVLTENASFSGADDDSHVTGTIVRTLASTSEADFPLGDGTELRQANVTPPDGTSRDWTVSYTSSAYGDLTLTGSLTNVSATYYWDITPSSAANSSVIDLNWTSNPGIQDADLTNIKLAHFTGTDWEEIATTTAGTTTSGSVSGTVSSFSPFTLGTVGANPLPIKLVTFYGEKQQKNNVLRWTTASEKNNDYFTIEKTTDGKEFYEVGRIEGAGNSIYQNSYSLTDANVDEVLNYYRLVQTDFDGDKEYSNLITIDNRGSEETERNLIQITNTWGQEITEEYSGVVIYIYSDGSVEKVFQN